jgi:multicomponent K+:H+ antiporter subunit G
MENTEFPLWAALLVSFFVLLGSGLALIGSLGLVRLQSFYQRIHAPTLSTSWGTGGIVMASIIYFSVAGGRFAFHEIFIGIFMVITVPVSLMLLGRAALYRDRASQSVSNHTTED